VVATRVGYAGGRLPDPTYHRPGDHAEAVEVTFDPAVLPYEELLGHFWRSQPATLPAGPGRVGHAVLARPEQMAAARASRRRAERAAGEMLTTPVLPAGTFWEAEPMHQKFELRRQAPGLVAELLARDGRALESTAASRLNAWLGGEGGEAALAAAARELGRSPRALAAAAGRAP
jgi:peptide methionine sulfoxide reductase MsrA